MGIYDKLLAEWDRRQADVIQPGGRWALVRLGVGTVILAGAVISVATVARDQIPQVGVWLLTVFLSTAVMVIAELALVPWLQDVRDGRLARRAADAGSFEQLDPRSPDFPLRLMRAHYRYLVGWTGVAERWVARTSVAGVAACLAGLTLLALAVLLTWSSGSTTLAPAAWLAGGAGAVAVSGGTLLLHFGGRMVYRVGRLARRVGVNGNLCLAKQLVDQPRAWLVSGGADAGVPAAVRINAGGHRIIGTDGSVWEADSGFDNSKAVDRGGIEIQNALQAPPDVYRSEHWGMTAFERALPNGLYTVRLHFAETDATVVAGQRVFTVNVGGEEIKDLDVVAEANGPRTAWFKDVNGVTVSSGKLRITFTKNPTKMDPIINGVEIIPRP